MKTSSLVTMASLLLFGTVSSRGADVARISAETGIPAATLQAERTSTGLGWGGLEKAHLLANMSGQSFDTVVGKFQGGEGWGRIAHDYNLNLGKVVSGARRSSHATAHANNTHMLHGKNATAVHGKSATHIGRGHTSRISSAHGMGHSMGHRSSFMGTYGTHSMGHMSGSRGMASMGHGGGHGR